jgi:hypothetical protein
MQDNLTVLCTWLFALTRMRQARVLKAWGGASRAVKAAPQHYSRVCFLSCERHTKAHSSDNTWRVGG